MRYASGIFLVSLSGAGRTAFGGHAALDGGSRLGLHPQHNVWLFWLGIVSFSELQQTHNVVVPEVVKKRRAPPERSTRDRDGSYRVPRVVLAVPIRPFAVPDITQGIHPKEKKTEFA